MRYFLSRDGSGHWYLVPADKRAEWSAWRELDEDDHRAWDPPEWAHRLGGSPERITFTDPQEES